MLTMREPMQRWSKSGETIIANECPTLDAGVPTVGNSDQADSTAMALAPGPGPSRSLRRNTEAEEPREVERLPLCAGRRCRLTHRRAAGERTAVRVHAV